MRHDPIDPGQSADVAGTRRRSRVRDFMTGGPATIGWEEPAASAWSLMEARKIRHLPVLDADQRLVGILSEADLREAVAGLLPPGRTDLAGAPPTLIVGKVMTPRTDAVHPDSDIVHAAQVMQNRKIDALTVVEDDRVIGILTDIDILRAFRDLLGHEGAPGGRGHDARIA
jgi:acetoin utilization protein AcuB